MQITIIGTGNMARGIGTRLLAGGHSVTFVGQSVSKAEALAEALRGGAAGGVAMAAAADAPLSGAVVVLAVPYAAAIEVVRQYGDQLAGRVIVDISNPIDFSTLSPVVAPGSSGAEELAKLAPVGASVVKAFNTIFAGALIAGQVAGQPLDVLIAGDDTAAKATLGDLITAGGLRVLDAGPLHRARQLEALGLLHIALQFTGNTGFRTAVKLLL